MPDMGTIIVFYIIHSSQISTTRYLIQREGHLTGTRNIADGRVSQGLSSRTLSKRSKISSAKSDEVAETC